MDILITLDILDRRICDVEPCDNTETYREFIHASLQSIDLDMSDEEMNNMTDDERTQLLDFADDIWGK